MMDNLTHYLVVFCQIGAVCIALTLLGVVLVWALGFVAAVSLGIVLMLVVSSLLALIIAAEGRT